MINRIKNPAVYRQDFFNRFMLLAAGTAGLGQRVSDLNALDIGLCDLLLAAHVAAEDLRNLDRAVRILVLLDNGGDDAAGCKAGTVERVAVFDLAAVLAAETDVAAAGLIVARVADGGDLLVAAHGGDVDLYIVGTRHRGAAITRSKLYCAEFQS